MTSIITTEQIHQIFQRIRTQTRYDSIATMIMNLLKKHHVYQKSKIFEKQLQKKKELKLKRNYVVLFYRLFFLQSELLKSSKSNQSIIIQIYQYFNANLDSVLAKKYSKNNSPQFISKTKQKNQNDIQVMMNILCLEDNCLQLAFELLGDLYKIQKVKNLDNTKKQKKKILHYFQMFRNGHQKQDHKLQSTMVEPKILEQEQRQPIINYVTQPDSDNSMPCDNEFVLNIREEQSNFLLPSSQQENKSWLEL